MNLMSLFISWHADGGKICKKIIEVATTAGQITPAAAVVVAHRVRFFEKFGGFFGFIVWLMTEQRFKHVKQQAKQDTRDS
jgi:hypothetical protein